MSVFFYEPIWGLWHEDDQDRCYSSYYNHHEAGLSPANQIPKEVWYKYANRIFHILAHPKCLTQISFRSFRYVSTYIEDIQSRNNKSASA